jgi:hypothetical protein
MKRRPKGIFIMVRFPDRKVGWLQYGSNDVPELNEVAKLSYDLRDIPEKDLERLRVSGRRRWYYQANLTLHLLVRADVQFWVTFGETELDRVILPYV